MALVAKNKDVLQQILSVQGLTLDQVVVTRQKDGSYTWVAKGTITPPKSNSKKTNVWVGGGKCYHANTNCMHGPNKLNKKRMTLDEAQDLYTPCSFCASD